MKKILTLLLVLFTISMQAFGQESSYAKPHKIIMQLQSGDTLAHKSLMKQLNNILTVSPKSQVEVVCHGPGISLLRTDKSKFEQKVKDLAVKGVQFRACEFTMSEMNIAPELIISGAGTVKYGLLEIVTKQEKGWSYLKAGF